jgi:hypothetical protein
MGLRNEASDRHGLLGGLWQELSPDPKRVCSNTATRCGTRGETMSQGRGKHRTTEKHDEVLLPAREEEAQESIALGVRVKPHDERRTATRSQALKPARPQTSVGGGATAGGLRASRDATTSFAGKSSEGQNPKSASGMKQGRRTSGGENRQEGEKPWRRTVAG